MVVALILKGLELERTYTHLYLLHSSQVLQLSVVDLLLQHQLLEVLSCVRLPLQRLESLKGARGRAKDRFEKQGTTNYEETWELSQREIDRK